MIKETREAATQHYRKLCRKAGISQTTYFN
jgi:hypothetical protein